MFVYPKKNSTLLFFRLLALALLSITLVQGFKSSCNMNLSNILNVNDHISMKSIPTPENKSYINYSAMEPVLFERLHDIKLLHSVFRVTFFLFISAKVALHILLQCTHNRNENLKTLYSTLVINNVFDSRSHDERQCIFSYSALLNSSFEELVDCKALIMQLTSQVDNMFAS